MALLLATADIASAQTGIVAGRVVDAQSSRPLTNAQISIPGTGLGGLTQADGTYRITGVPAGTQTVRVQILGYATQEETVNVSSGATATADFRLSQDAINLTGIVVTGVGQETEKRKLSTSVDVISAEEISEIPVTSVDQLLQGRVAGATVNAQSAQAGTATLINFRGASSVFGSQTPVIYVDGVRVDNSQSTAAGTGGEQSSAIADLLTSDIERIEITKGGAASTLYGSDAATGVIQIFTKQGTPGAPRFTFRSEYGWDQPELKYMFDTPLTFPGLVESGDVSPTFMDDNYWQTGFALNQYLAVNGGSDRVTYNVSGRVQNEDGVQPKNQSSIYAVRGGLRANINEDFTVNFSGNYTRSQFERLFNGAAIADPLTTFEVGDALFFSGAETLDEALDIFLSPDIDEQVDRFIVSGGFDWSITPDWFARLSTGIDYRSNQQRTLEPIGFTPGEPEGELTRFDRSKSTFSFDAATGYSWISDSGDFANDITVGVQGYREDLSIISSTGTTFALPGAPDFDEAADISSFEINEEVFTGGLYVDESFDLWSRLTLSAGVRFDGSTAFGDEVTFETYPKAGLSYLVSNEDFFPTGGFVNELKLRGAYGETGKPPTPFDKDASFSAVSFRGESAPRFDNPGNEDLRPERTVTYEAGFDASLFNSRVGLDFTWFDATTTDALFFVPEQPVTGQGTQLRNVGELSNRGIEVAMNVQVVNMENFAWTLGGTYQTVDNKVTDMGGAAAFFVEAQKRVCGPPVDCNGDGDVNSADELPVGAWYVTTPIDTNGDGLLDDSELQFTGGQPQPTSSGSINTSFRLGTAWTISSLADFAFGHEVMDYGSVWSTFNGIYRRETVRCVPESEWTTGGTPGADCAYLFPVQYDTDGNELGRYFQSSARSAFIYDGDWFKWREISVRYQLPRRLANALRSDRGALYASGRNLWIWSENQMIDPELNGLSGGGLELGGESSITASPPRRFRFGIELVF
ncbi:MAG: TonB-dependent receptor [Longimicrobiales bacterium]|nr:TonB-dependent receptor [Longimicrobiales bacterium]